MANRNQQSRSHQGSGRGPHQGESQGQRSGQSGYNQQSGLEDNRYRQQGGFQDYGSERSGQQGSGGYQHWSGRDYGGGSYQGRGDFGGEDQGGSGFSPGSYGLEGGMSTRPGGYGGNYSSQGGGSGQVYSGQGQFGTGYGQGQAHGGPDYRQGHDYGHDQGRSQQPWGQDQSRGQWDQGQWGHGQWDQQQNYSNPGQFEQGGYRGGMGGSLRPGERAFGSGSRGYQGEGNRWPDQSRYNASQRGMDWNPQGGMRSQEFGGEGYQGSEYGRQYGGGSGTGMARGSNAGRGPKGWQRSDERIKEDVCERLYHDEHIDSSEVTVEVMEGKVTLEGKVGDRYMKHLIEDLVDAVPGVKDIDNRVRVEREGAQQAQAGGGANTQMQSPSTRKRNE